MSETYEDLKGKTVAELREIAKEHEHEALQGYSSMKKAELLDALCTALGIAESAPPAAPSGAARGTAPASLKGRIHELKAERGAALEAKDRQQLRRVRRRIQRLKRRMRKQAAHARATAPAESA